MSTNRLQYSQACAVLYSRPQEISAADLAASLDPSRMLGCRVSVDGSHDDGNLLVRGRIELGHHHIDIVSVAAPAADQASILAVQGSELTPDDSRLLLGHQAYVHCLYAGGSANPLEQLRSLYRVVMSLFDTATPEEALGFLNVPALIAFTRADAVRMLKWLDSEPPPFGLWVRIVALGGESGSTWLVTRGLFAFLLPEIAVNGTYVSDEQSGESLLMSIASWLIQGLAQLQVGDTLEMLAEEDRESKLSRWLCRAPTRQQRFLAAPYGTLILEPA